MSMEYKCDMCCITLTNEYKQDAVWRDFELVPIGVGDHKYIRECIYPDRSEFSYTRLARSYLKQLNMFNIELCQECIQKCFAAIDEETKQIYKWSCQRRENLNAFLANNLQQFKEGKK